jgi:hypothetical protein
MRVPLPRALLVATARAAALFAVVSLTSCSKAAPPNTAAPEAGSSTTTYRSNSPAMSFTLERVANPGPTDLYDGLEPSKYNVPVLKVPSAKWHGFTFEDLAKSDLKGLAAILGEDAFHRIVTERKLRQAMPGAPWTSDSRLSLSFVIAPPLTPRAPGSPPTQHELAIVGFGEWQPARYVVQLDSLWRIERAP